MEKLNWHNYVSVEWLEEAQRSTSSGALDKYTATEAGQKWLQSLDATRTQMHTQGIDYEKLNFKTSYFPDIGFDLGASENTFTPTIKIDLRAFIGKSYNITSDGSIKEMPLDAFIAHEGNHATQLEYIKLNITARNDQKHLKDIEKLKKEGAGLDKRFMWSFI